MRRCSTSNAATMLFRIIEWMPDYGRGYAVACDPQEPRKIFVHNSELVSASQKMQIGKLIEVEKIAPPRKSERQHVWIGLGIRVVR
jgi:hypothetical protein